MLIIYRFLILILIILSPLIIIFRIMKGKEDPKRFKEKFSFKTEKKIKGKLIWFHGSSIGEILSVMPLIEKLEKNKNIKQILITSNTLSSSRIIKKFNLKKTVHQFFPIDSKIFIRKFLRYWKPSSVFFIESEIWPNMILEINKNKIPLILINARITKKTFRKWINFKRFSRSIFDKFDICLAQNEESVKYLKELGSSNVKKEGNLKFSNYEIVKKKKLDNKTLNFLKSKRILFCGLSTHAKEELFCAHLHRDLKNKIKNSLTIIIPRHIDRVDDIINDLKIFNFNIHLHSSQKRIERETEIYLVDSFGETEAFIRYCKIVFLGGSLIKHGGQNPLEAARLGCKVLYGPNIYNFKEVYKILNKYRIAFKIKSKRDALIKIKNIIKKNKINNKVSKLNFIGNKILDNNFRTIQKYI